jgi:hypothetical protein
VTRGHKAAGARPWNSGTGHEGRGLTREQDDQLGGSGSKVCGRRRRRRIFHSREHGEQNGVGRTPAPNLEEKLKEFLNSDKVSSIDFVLPNKEDKTFPHDIYIDDAFYVRIAGG